MKYFLPPYTPESITKQYKNLVKTLHPDKGGSEEEFKRMIQEKEAILEALKDQQRPKPKPKQTSPTIKKKVIVKIIHFDLNDIIKKSLKL